MAARATWKGFLKISLVNIPIKVFPATESSATIAFNQLHGECRTRIQQKRWCPHCNREVPNSEIVKGYEFEKGRYVVLSEEDFDKVRPESTRVIDLVQFAEESAIDPMYVDRTYYLGPDKGGERAYKLLAEALEKTKRVAIGQYAARGKQYLIMVRPLNGALVMEQLRYADEIRNVAEIPIPKTEVKKPELDLATKLIEQAATDEFHPEKYKDNVRDRMMEQIERKVEGKQITEEPEQAPKTKVLDLMQALKQSLETGPAEEKEKPAKRRKVAGKR